MGRTVLVGIVRHPGRKRSEDRPIAGRGAAEAGHGKRETISSGRMEPCLWLHCR